MFCGMCKKDFGNTLPEQCPDCKCIIFAHELTEQETIPYSIQQASYIGPANTHPTFNPHGVQETKQTSEPGPETIPLKRLLYHYRFISGDWKAFYAEEFDWLDDTTHQSPYWAENEAKPGRSPEGLKERLISLFNKWEPTSLDQIPTPAFMVSIRGNGFLRDIALASDIGKVKSIAKDCMNDSKGWLEGVLNQRTINTKDSKGKVVPKSDLEHHYPKLYNYWYPKVGK